MPQTKFEDFFRNIVAVFPKSEDIIYSEYSPASHIFLIYQGNCKLQKNLNQRNDKKDSHSSNVKLITILNLEKGDISGLESLSGTETYNHTLIVFIVSLI